MKEIAEIYYNLGLSAIPVDSKKIPRLSENAEFRYTWGKHQESLIKPNGIFDKAWGMGIVCGKVSGNLECIDIDCKYDLTGNLFEEYKKAINEADNNLLKKLVVEKSPNGGYHFIYRCPRVEPSKELAKRYATPDEQKPKGEKEKVLIETRGEGGYFACAPTKGYEFIYRDFTQIQTISESERDILWGCAKIFNEIVVEYKPRKEYKKSENVFEKFNQNGDVEEVLLNAGWTYKGNCRGNRMYLRPNGEQQWSAGYHPETKLFRVFSSSTEFEINHTYNPSQVLAYVNFNKDYSATALWLEKNGYGERSFSEVRLDDEHDFIATDEEIDSYITQIREGTFQMGLTTGLPSLDKHWLFKHALLVLMLGHDNVGKSVFGWFLACQSAKLHDWKWIIWSGENKVGGIKKKILEFYLCKKIKDFTEAELASASAWFKQHFTLIKNNKLYTYKDMLNIGRKLNEKKKYDAFMIDPYNGLFKETDNEHMYDYHAMQEFLQFRTDTSCAIYLCVHAITEALRRRYPKEHDLAGQPMPPHKADTEGGGKFSNKADDFLIIHRMPQHKDEWMNMEIHVQKIKEAESGGKQTVLDEPVKLRMMRGSIGYEELNIVQTEIVHNPDATTEPKKLIDETKLPF